MTVQWQLAAFFILLLLNTFFSVRCFRRIPESSGHLQNVVNGIILLLYIALATQLSSAGTFLELCILMFFVASLKYALMLPSREHQGFLRRKIIIDLLGGIVCTVTRIGVSAGLENISLTVWALCFTLVNIDLLILHPFYIPTKDRL